MKRGAKTKLTEETKSKILEVASLDGTVEEMAYYCDVSRQTIYNWFEDDKELFDKVERLRERPILLARQTINKKMTENYSNAMDYLKRKAKKEFGDSQSVEITTPKPLLDVLQDNNSNEENTRTEETN